MGFLQNAFGMNKPDGAETAPAPQSPEIPPERVGLNGEHDDSGLAKRVALALDEDSSFDDITTLYVAQTGSTVVFKGSVPSQDFLDKATEIARSVSGTQDVASDQVGVG